MQSTGQAWLVLQITQSPLALGTVGALQFTPVLIFSLFGGVLADRLPRHKVLMITQSVAMTLAFLLWLLVALNAIQLWHIYVLAFCLGMVNAVDMPTRQSFMKEVVGREHLTNAIALNSSAMNLARICGPAIAGLIIAWVGNAPLFLLNAFSFLPLIITFASMRLEAPQRSKQDMPLNPFVSIWEGLTYVGKTPSLRLLILTVGIISLIGINFNVALPLYAQDALHIDAAGFGFLSSCFGIGSLSGALFLAWSGKLPTVQKFLTFGLLFSIAEVCFGAINWFPISAMLIACVGFTQITFMACANTTVQTIAPDHLRGRIMSVYMFVFAGTVPFGNLLMGWLSGLVGVSLALVITGSVCLLIASLGWSVRKPAIADLQTFLRKEERVSQEETYQKS